MSYGKTTSFKKWDEYPEGCEVRWFICPNCRMSFLQESDSYVLDDYIECPCCNALISLVMLESEK